MFCGSIMMATLVGTVSANDIHVRNDCSDCAFNVSALEEFSVDFSTVTYFVSFDNPQFSHDPYDPDQTPYDPSRPVPVINFETTPLPSSLPTEHGSIALHARNLQLKLDNHATFPPGFTLGNGYQNTYGEPRTNFNLGGMEFHEELHINGAARQASFFLETPILTACVQVDFPPQVTVPTPLIDQHLQQAEQVVPMIIQQQGVRAKVNGEDVVGMVNPQGGPNEPIAAVLFTESGHPALLSNAGFRAITDGMQPIPSEYVLGHLAIKFDNYAPTVADAFAVRACDIESHSATESLLASSPAAREFIADRVAQHQRHLQALLEPEMMNTHFNFIPLEISDFMFPAQHPCATDEFAQIPSAVSGSFQMGVFAVGSFAAGVATVFGVLRMKARRSAEDYQLVNP